MTRVAMVVMVALAGCASPGPRAPLPCWHSEVLINHELALEVRAKDKASAERLVAREMRRHPTDWSVETWTTEPAESVAVRFHRDPAAVCR